MGRYRYFLAIQTLLPEDYRNDAAFRGRLKTLQEWGFDGIELNIREPEAVRPDDLKQFLGDFGLVLSVFATGFTAKTAKLSLAATDQTRRKESVRRTKDFLAFAAAFGAGAVAGFLKGAPGESSAEHLANLKTSVAELAPEALRLKTPFIIEAINRFESPLGNSLEEVWQIIRDVKNPYVHILPDTWHMNIEESNMEAAMIRHRERFINFHLSDNNRFLPGFGALDFKKIIGVLDALGYSGRLALEANLKGSFSEDVTKSMEYLAPLLAK
jgi:sugar phosphate isomerase/epimerase